MKNITRSLIAFLIVMAVCGWALPAFAQTATYNTTLSVALNATTRTVTLASSSNLPSTATAGSATWLVYCDGEEMKINSVNGAVLQVTRGYGPTQAGSPPYKGTHPAGAICWFGPASSGPFIQQQPVPGVTCASTNYQFLPLIVESTGVVWDCPTQTNRFQYWNPSLGLSNGYTPISDAAYTAKLTDYVIAYTYIAAARTVTLPTPNLGMVGKTYIVKNTSTYGTNTIWVTPIKQSGAIVDNNLCAFTVGTNCSGAVTVVQGAVVGAAAPSFPASKYFTDGVSWFVIP